jgi:glycosyltransferase involved in cell wall biosynthesis
MRISIIGSRGYPYVYSGYETFVGELAERMVARGHSVVVYCHRGLFKERPVQVRGVELVYVPALERKTLSQFSHSLLSTLHLLVRSTDVAFFVNSANGPMGLLTWLSGKRTAINVDGMEWMRPKWKGLGARYFKASSYLATKFFDVVVTDSLEMGRVYERTFDAQSATIAYGATPRQSTRPEMIRRFGIQNGEYYLVVGRLIPDNNADLIVRAFENSPTQRKLVIVGDVPYRDRFAERVKRTKDSRIVFTGYIHDQDLLSELYLNAYAYIHGHEFGGTNPTLLKALACGCCILALDTPFAREVLSGEDHGVYFQKDERGFLAQLERLENEANLVSRMRETARPRAEEHYSWDKIIDEYEALFDNLVSR